MLIGIYNIGIYLANIFVHIIAPFNHKLKLGVNGRKATFDLLKHSINQSDKTFWFHCASLGEYEQGIPVFEALKKKHPNYKVVLSFFSPSGYEVRKNSKIADIVVYLPFDTKRNAKDFLNIVNPTYIIFVKYEIWPNFLNEIKRRQINAILISALFRENHSFFKWYGKFMSKSLFAFSHIFTQNEHSKKLLSTINYRSVTVSGDTRFDRVYKQLSLNNNITFIEEFIDNKTCIVFGSTWPADDKLFINFINKNTNKDLKFLIAPHNIKQSYIASIEAQLNVKHTSFTKMENKSLNQNNVFILDTIGYLTKVYSYASIAYVGGGAGKTGLHNILEPAVFGIPIIIGENYSNFPEAKELIERGGVTSVSSSDEFQNILDALVKNCSLRNEIGTVNSKYITKNKGAVNQIMDYIRI